MYLCLYNKNEKNVYFFHSVILVYSLWFVGSWFVGLWFMVHGSWVRRFMFFVLCWLTLSLIEFDWARSRIQRSQTPVPNC